MDCTINDSNDLENLKKEVEKSYEYFKPNYELFNEYRKFIFKSSLTPDDISLLKTLMKPQIESNVLEAYISRLRGEWSKQEPSIRVGSNHDSTADPATIKIVEGHARHIICDANKNGCSYDIITDTLSGGYSVAKVWMDYANEMSFDQVIKYERVYDPTLCGFDPLARLPSKSDGNYSFEIYPMLIENFKKEYPKVETDKLKFVKNIEGFNWSYSNDKSDVILLCCMYKKKKKKANIVRLVDGQVMTTSDYKEFVNRWESSGIIAVPPAVVGKPRKTILTKICRYVFIENKIIEYSETKYRFLPHVFFPGNSMLIREDINGSIQEICRPYVYHAKGIQKLKNYAVQCLANELENMVMHKFKVPKEGIPPEYLDAYTNYQIPNVLIYNAFKDDNPDVPLPPPQEISRVPTPPEVSNTISQSDQIIQNILGSFDASLGINDNQLSGIAIVEGATQSNSAAMPYVVGYMQGLTQVCQIILSLIPLCYVTPRTMPVTLPDGTKDFVEVNNDGGVKLNYSDSSLNVNVEAGVNFAVQKSRALQQIIGLMQASPLFAQFMNQEGLSVLLDNIEIRGIDQLKEMSENFMNQLKEQQRMMAEQQKSQQEQNPLVMRNEIDKQKLIYLQNKEKNDAAIDAANLAISKQKADNEKLKIMADLHQSHNDNIVQMEKSNTEKVAKAVDLAIKTADMSHRHNKEARQMEHLINQSIENDSA